MESYILRSDLLQNIFVKVILVGGLILIIYKLLLSLLKIILYIYNLFLPILQQIEKIEDDDSIETVEKKKYYLPKKQRV
jgi:hypothetical protein